MTLDDLQNGYCLYQSENGFRFGADAVLLSDYVKADPGDRILDLGTGNGIIPVLLAAKGKGEHITGLELQKEQVMLAEKSLEYNGLSEKIDIINGDIKDFRELLRRSSFEIVVCNPPYVKAGAGKTAADSGRAAARHELFCTFDDICEAAAYALKPAGRFFFVHRPWRLAELIRILSGHGFELKKIRFVHPHAGKDANLFLAEALKGGAAGLAVEAPRVMYE